ncbi:MAG TPA: hypothetical protein V6C81_25340 [Planktothrix sp.]|jgi:hypothetical protein
MSGDVSLNQSSETELGTSTALPGHDGLAAYRGGDSLTIKSTQAPATDAQPLSGPTSVASDEIPFNPDKRPGTYDPNDVTFAKEHFTSIQLLQLEAPGPKYFNKVLDYARKRSNGGFPSQKDVLKFMKHELDAQKQVFLQQYHLKDQS